MPSVSVTQGSLGGSVGDHMVVTAVNAGAGSYEATLAPDAAWADGGWVRAAVMVETEDSLGNTEVLRRWPFFGSGVTEYAEQGFSFDPIVERQVSAMSASPSVAPSIAPSAAPSAAPSGSPSSSPSASPTSLPAAAPTAAPTGSPSGSPTSTPSSVSHPRPEVFEARFQSRIVGVHEARP